MALYIRLSDGLYPVSEQFIRNTNQNTSFSTPFIAPSEYAIVHPSPLPTIENPVLQVAEELPPEMVGNGNWEQRWGIRDIYFDYTDAQGITYTKEELEANAIAADENLKKQSNSLQATRLLQAEDWIENPSVSNTALIPHLSNFEEYMTYRLALRAIAINPPVNVEVWPQAPEKVWITE